MPPFTVAQGWSLEAEEGKTREPRHSTTLPARHTQPRSEIVRARVRPADARKPSSGHRSWKDQIARGREGPKADFSPQRTARLPCHLRAEVWTHIAYSIRKVSRETPLGSEIPP